MGKVDFDLDKNYFVNVMGMEILERDEEKAIGKMEIQKVFYNAIGAVHGGVLISFADTVTGACANYNSSPATTLSSTFNFLKPVIDSKCLYGYARKIKRGKKISVYDVEIKDGNGELKAQGNFTYYVL